MSNQFTIELMLVTSHFGFLGCPTLTSTVELRQSPPGVHRGHPMFYSHDVGQHSSVL